MHESLYEDGAVLLISCYESGHQPIGLAMPAAFLERAGFRPACLDTSVQGLDGDRVRRARFVGISVPMHTAIRLATRVAARVRALNPPCHICFFGLYASLNSGFLLDGVADTVIGGEYEGELVRLVRALNGEAETWRGVSGIENRSSTPVEKLNFPVPERRRLPSLENYVRFRREDHRSLVAHVEATRGCKHVCRHCPITPVYDGRFFVVPVNVVLEDLRRQIAAGARHVTFGDPDFLNGPGHSIRIAKAMHREFPDVSFDFTAKIEHLLRHKAIFGDFAEMGCAFIVSAVESLNDVVLRHLDKGHTRADFLEALRIVRGVGITLRPSFVSFTPWTSLDDYIDVLETVESEELVDSVDPIQYAIRLLIPPGSALLAYPAIRPMVGKLRPDSFTYEWTHPDPTMDRLHRQVSDLVEEGVRNNEDNWTIFLQIRDLAFTLNGGHIPLNKPVPSHPRHRVGLTEPWFC